MRSYFLQMILALRILQHLCCILDMRSGIFGLKEDFSIETSSPIIRNEISLCMLIEYILMVLN